jgi:hypothetical protein
MIRLLAGMLLASAAWAEIQIDVDPTGLPSGAIVLDVLANIGSPDSNSNYSSDISGPSGIPPMWHAVWQVDDQVTMPAPINSMTIVMDCGGSMLESTLTYAPFSVFYIPGPNNPPVAPTVFPDLNPGDNCVAVPPLGVFPEGFGLVSVSPNPFNPSATVRFSLPSAGELIVALYNLRGAKVREVYRGQRSAGEGEMVLDGSDLSSGLYILDLRQAGMRDSTTVNLVK